MIWGRHVALENRLSMPPACMSARIAESDAYSTDRVFRDAGFGSYYRESRYARPSWPPLRSAERDEVTGQPADQAVAQLEDIAIREADDGAVLHVRRHRSFCHDDAVRLEVACHGDLR